MKILCIGHASYDITLPLAKFPKENTKNRVNNVMECGGGPANNAAYLLGSWGMDVHFAGLVGNDYYGRVIQNELETVNVDTKYLELSPMITTTTSFVIVGTKTGLRTVLACRTNNMTMHKFDLDFEPDVILMDGQEYEQSLDLINKYPEAITIIDAGRPNPEIVALAKRCNYIVCSKEFAEVLTDIKININKAETMVQAYQKLQQMFRNSIIVITVEAGGAIYEYNHDIKLMPSMNVQAQDTTGAGDIFHGAFTYGIANNYDLEAIIKFSNIAGAISVTRVGGRNSMPTKEEIRAYDEDFK